MAVIKTMNHCIDMNRFMGINIWTNMNRYDILHLLPIPMTSFDSSIDFSQSFALDSRLQASYQDLDETVLKINKNRNRHVDQSPSVTIQNNWY